MKRSSSVIVLLCALVVPAGAVAQEVEIAAAIAFTEGPTADREGNVYFTDIMSQRIMKLSKDGVVSTYREHSNAANGLLIDREGRLVACEGAPFTRSGVSVKGNLYAAAGLHQLRGNVGNCPDNRASAARDEAQGLSLSC